MRTLAAVISLFACATVLGQSTHPAAQVGNFEVTFTEHSPLSDPKAVAKRLSLQDNPDGYELKDFPCLVHVPENYSAAKPVGLVVLLNYKQSDELPASVLPQFDEANCALVVPEPFDMPYINRVGIALDLAHNMKQRYAIDPKRVYVFGFDADYSGQRLLLGFPEVFTGAYLSRIAPYRAIKQKREPAWKPDEMIQKPDAKSFTLAKSHPVYIGTPDRGDGWEKYANLLKEDGFKFVRFESWDSGRIHYPMYATNWVPGVFKFLDAATEKLAVQPPPATKPAAPSSK